MKNSTFRNLLPMLFIGAFLFYKYILQVSPSVMTAELMKQFHLTATELGQLGACFFYSYLITQVFVGPLLDRVNPRYLTASAILVCALGAMGMSASHRLIEAEMSRVLMGVGAAFATVAYLKMASLYLKPKQFATASGLLASFAMLGSMAGQAPMAFLVAHSSWRQSLMLVAILGATLAASFLVWVKDPPSCGKDLSHKLSLEDFKTLLKQPVNWYLMLYSGLAFSPLAVFGGLWGNPFLEASLQLTKTQAASLTSMCFLGLAIGGPLAGSLSTRFGKPFPLMFIGCLLSLFSLTAVIYLPLSVGLTSASLFLFGLGTGSFMLGFELGKNVNSISLAATVVGLINTGDAFFGAITEPMVGRLLDLASHARKSSTLFSLADFHLAFGLLPLYLILATLCLLLVWRNSNK